MPIATVTHRTNPKSDVKAPEAPPPAESPVAEPPVAESPLPEASLQSVAEPDLRAESPTGSVDPVRDYLRAIGRISLLTADDEVDLARRIEVGLFAEERLEAGVDDPALERDLRRLIAEGVRAKSRFIQANLKLVVSIAKRYTGRGLPLLDLVQEGNLGLVRAVEKYDFTTGFKFSTYATWWIRQSISRGLADNARIIRIPVHTVEKMNKLERIRRDLAAELQREPTRSEIANASGLTEAEVERLQGSDHEPVSLQTPVGGEGDGELGELIRDDDCADPSDAAVLTLRTADIDRHVSGLPEREAQILRRRYGLDGEEPMTLDQLGAFLGVTRERVRQIEKRALHKLALPELKQYLSDD